MSGRPLVPTPERPCGYPGCETPTRTRLGYCPAHYYIAYPCSFDPSCRHRCAAHSKTRLCQEHAWFGEKLRMMRARERGEAAAAAADEE